MPGVSLPPQAEDDQDFARRIVMKVNRFGEAESNGDHLKLFVANGSHSLYLQSGSVAVTFAGNRSYGCGYEYIPPVSTGGGGDDGPSDPALIFLLKILGGTILDSAVGLFVGWIVVIPEGVAPSAGRDIVGELAVNDEPPPDQIAPARSSKFVHPQNVPVPDGGTDLGNWRSA